MEEIVNKMSQQYNSQLERIVLKKLMDIRKEAFESREGKLFQILNEIDFKNVVKTKNELEKFGYILALELPEPEFNYDKNDTGETISVSTSIKEEDVKIKIMKVIFEA